MARMASRARSRAAASFLLASPFLSNSTALKIVSYSFVRVKAWDIRLDALGRSIALFNVAIDERRDGDGCCVDLILGFGHVQLAHQLLERLEGL